jgi:hypothetical protein
VWRGWQPEGLVHCRQIDYRWIASVDDWWDMYWGTWDHNAGSEVGADARMHTTDGVRLDAKPDAATILAAN